MSDTQLALALPNVRHTDPRTSHIAAARDRTFIRDLVVEALNATPGGLTDWELTEAVGLEPIDKPTVGKRRQECGARRVLVDGEPLTRPSPKGTQCQVWTLR